MKKKVLIIGSLNMDLVTNTDIMPEMGETVYGTSFRTYPGGKGANQAVACGRLASDVSMLGCVGNDEFGASLTENLSKNNVNAENIRKIDNTTTGIATIVVYKNDNFIILEGGANKCVTPEYLDKLSDVIYESDYIILQNEVPLETNLKILTDKKIKAKIIYNPAPAIKLDKKYYEYIDILIPNQHECGYMLNQKIKTIDDAKKAAKELCENGIKNVIITLGGNGAVFNDSDEYIHTPCFPVKAVDTTAAGDSFCAGIVTALSNDMKIKEAVNFASAVAALTVTKNGAQTSLPFLSDVEEFLGKL